MIRRTFSTVILWTALGGVLYGFGPHAGVWLIALLAVASQHEMYRMLESTGGRPLRLAGLIVGAVLVLGPFYGTLTFDGFDPRLTALSVLALGTILAAVCVLARPHPHRISALGATSLGLVFVAFPLHFFVQILLLPADPTAGLLLALWVIVAVKFADIGAYVFGSLIGKHKLAPELSPGKTWEGVGGGLASSVLLACGFAAVFGEHLPSALTPLNAAALALPIAAISVPSDLLESVFKRESGAKDSGRTIPGIGGAYDLSDSLILSAPVAFVLLHLFIFP